MPTYNYVVTFYLEIDWGDGNGWTNETANALEITTNRGKDAGVSGDGYAMTQPGEMTAIMRDTNARFNPLNTASSLYGYVEPGLLARLRFTIGALAEEYIFTGALSNIRLDYTGQKAVLNFVDGLAPLTRLKCASGPIQQNIDVKTAVQTILTDGNYIGTSSEAWTFPVTFETNSTLGSVIIPDTGDIMPYWWPNPDQSVNAALTDLAQAWHSLYFVTRRGTFVWLSRPHIYNPTIENSDYFSFAIPAFTSDSNTKERTIKANYDQQAPWELIRNRARIVANPLTETAANEVLWSLAGVNGGDVLSIAPGDTASIWADYTYQLQPASALSVTTPVSGTDYIANSAADGGGTNLTSSITITLYQYSQNANLSIYNASTQTAYLTTLQLRGTGLYVASPSSVIERDEASIINYGEQTVNIDSPWIQETSEAQYHADYAIDELSGLPSVIYTEIDYRNSGLAYADESSRVEYNQLGLELYMKVNVAVTYPSWSFQGVYRITQIEQSIKPGKDFRTKVRLEMIQDNGDLWTFPVTFEGSTANNENGSILGW